MANRPVFGRRAGQAPPPPPKPRPGPVAVAAVLEAPAPSADAIDLLGVDPELEEWKATRKRNIPWRALSLMASLCFGIASLVLPAVVNELVQWPLYALTAISLYVGITTRRAKKAEG